MSCKMNVFRGALESACLSICLSVHQCEKYCLVCARKLVQLLYLNFVNVFLSNLNLCKMQFSTINSLWFKNYLPLNIENICYSLPIGGGDVVWHCLSVGVSIHPSSVFPHEFLSGIVWSVTSTFTD